MEKPYFLKRREDSERQNKEREKRSEEIQKIASAIEGVREEVNRTAGELRASDVTKSRREKAALFVAVVVAIAALWQLREMDGQLDIMRGQLNQSIYDQRPWITYNPRGLYPITYGADQDASIRLDGVIQNAGKSPATNIVIKYETIVLTKENAFEQPGRQNELCNKARMEADANKMQLPLRPGQEQPAYFGTTISKQQRAVAFPNPNDYIVVINGCIDYTFNSDQRSHGQTGFSYQLARVVDDGAHRAGFNPSDPPIPIDQMALEADPFHPPILK